ncbi:amidohydrolase family protein [Rhodococcus opacus]|uniref:amidohydrolase family protein n=1 Tax=Rhodococcus opacus TaxID=37919 RepID=UPI000AD48FB2|nr:amidohydrolase family protein [Rhodococcus opacus]
MTSTTLLSARLLDSDRPVDICITDGRISSVTSAGTAPLTAGVTYDAGGRVVLPGFVEPHLHLDKAFLGTPAAGGSLREAIAHTAAAKALFTDHDVRIRAMRVLARAVAHGTTSIRAHTEIDPDIGLLSVRVIDNLARQLAGVVDVQVAPFPQEGLFCRPGTMPLLREALEITGTVVGGCPYAEDSLRDAQRHVDAILDFAVEFGIPADLHLDLANDDTDPRFTLAEYVAHQTVARGLEGRVAIGHVTTLAALTLSARGRVLDALAAARITVVALPATDLYLMGRDDERNVRRGVAPIRELWSAGVPTALSSNNIRNAFTPTGRADPLDIALLAARVSHVSSPDEFTRIVGMTTVAAAAVVRPGEPHGVTVGARGDLVVLDTDDPTSLLFDQPPRTLVLTGGLPVYTERRERDWHHRARQLELAK